MGGKILDARTWTNLELRGLLEDDESHVHFERAKRHLGLHPFHLTNLNAALREILCSTLYSYDTNLKGIILSYKNPKLLSRLGTVFYDTCFVHIDIEADFYVFRPNVGDSMKGIVNKKSQDHVGILVHKVFNVSILRPDDDKNEDDWPGYLVEIGQEVRFTITYLDFKGKLPYIRGSMEAANYLKDCKLFEASFARPIDDEGKPKKTVFSSDNEEVDAGFEADSKVDTKSVSQTLLGVDMDEKVLSRKQKKLKREQGEDEIPNMKRKRKQKLEDGLRLTDNESSLIESNRIDEDSGCGERFSLGKLKKLKRENNEDKSPAKKKKKSKVKVEEMLSDDQTKIHDKKIKFLEGTRNAEEEYLPRKSKKLKRENADDDSIYPKHKAKPKLELEITYADEEFDVAHKNNGIVKIKDEHTEERKKKKRHSTKVELRTSESDSDVRKTKHVKRTQNGSSGEKIKKRDKIKTEVSSSENESNVVTGERQSGVDSENENISEEHRVIKTEARASDVSD